MGREVTYKQKIQKDGFPKKPLSANNRGWKPMLFFRDWCSSRPCVYFFQQQHSGYTWRSGYHLLLISKAKEKIKSLVAYCSFGNSKTQTQLLFFPLLWSTTGTERLQLEYFKTDNLSRSKWRGVLSLKYRFGHSNHLGSVMISGSRISFTVLWASTCYSLIMLWISWLKAVAAAS